MNSRFNYPNLRLEHQEIRLVKLEHRLGYDFEICCEMSVHELKPDLKYTALSYTWGKESRNRILVNGENFYDYDNLLDFLALQSTNADFCRDTYLWIDQLCIAQTDMRERNHQVNLMSKIYGLATSTIVWLGLPGKGNAMGGDVASKVAKAIHDLVDASRSLTRIDIPCEDFIAPTDLCSAADILCRHPLGIIRLLKSADYWRRLWILQEVLLSKHLVLHCGEQTIEWAYLERCFDLWVPLNRKLTAADFAYSVWNSESLDKSRKRVRPSWESNEASIRDIELWQLGYLIQHKKTTHFCRKEGLTWKQALQLSQGSSCAQLHDKIFGLLGIVRDTLRFHADYRMQPRELFDIVLRLEIGEEPDARSAMVQHSGPAILSHNREASFIADRLGLGLSYAAIQKIVEDIYFQIGRWEFLESFIPELFGARPSPAWDHAWAHEADVTGALGIAPVAHLMYSESMPKPLTPEQERLQASLVRHILEEVYGKLSPELVSDPREQPSSAPVDEQVDQQVPAISQKVNKN